MVAKGARPNKRLGNKGEETRDTETFWLNLNWSLEMGEGNEVREDEVKV